MGTTMATFGRHVSEIGRFERQADNVGDHALLELSCHGKNQRANPELPRLLETNCSSFCFRLEQDDEAIPLC